MKIEKFVGVLEEGISPVVYHTTSVVNMFDILKSDTFVTSSAFKHNEIGYNKGKLYFFSVARSKLNSYLKDEHGNIHATMKLDGRKFANQYKAYAMDYFPHDRSVNEMEDRILTDKSSIPNASKYIQEIDILINPERVQPSRFLKYLTSIHFLATRKGITTRVYFNKNDLVSNNVSRSLSIPKAISHLMGTVPKTVDEYKTTMRSNDFKRDNTKLLKVHDYDLQRTEKEARSIIRILTTREESTDYNSFELSDWKMIERIASGKYRHLTNVLYGLKKAGKHKTIQDIIRIARSAGAGRSGIDDLEHFLIQKCKNLIKAIS